MEIILFRTVGILGLALIHFWFYMKSRLSWMLLLAIGGLMVFIANLVLGTSQAALGDMISIIYLFTTIAINSYLRVKKPSLNYNLSQKAILVVLLVSGIGLWLVVAVLMVVVFGS
jgi:hypothetical protein